MITTLSTLQKSQLNQMNRSFSYGSGSASGFSQFIADILAVIGTGEIGITSAAYDVDSLCLGGGAFSQDADTTTGLTFGYFQGSFYNGQGEVEVTAGTIALSASTSNYIEVDHAGTVHCTSGGFTPSRLPLYTIATGASSITTITNAKTLLTLLGAGSIPGAMLSAAAASKSAQVGVGTLTATSTYLAYAPCTGVLTAAQMVSPAAIAQSDTSYWTIGAVDLGAVGTGTQALLATTPVNTTKATGGNALAANVPLALTLTALTGGDTQLNVTEGDIIAVTFTANGSPPPLTGSVLRMKFSFTN